MYLSERLDGSILRSEVNWFISIMFVGSFALGAGLIIWHAAYGKNPVADLIANAIAADTQLPN